MEEMAGLRAFVENDGPIGHRRSLELWLLMNQDTSPLLRAVMTGTWVTLPAERYNGVLNDTLTPRKPGEMPDGDPILG